jgi:hypothetical protein
MNVPCLVRRLRHHRGHRAGRCGACEGRVRDPVDSGYSVSCVNHFALLWSWFHASADFTASIQQRRNQETCPIIFRC